jgi:hypothetical protein
MACPPSDRPGFHQPDSTAHWCQSPPGISQPRLILSAGPWFEGISHTLPTTSSRTGLISLPGDCVIPLIMVICVHLATWPWRLAEKSLWSQSTVSVPCAGIKVTDAEGWPSGGSFLLLQHNLQRVLRCAYLALCALFMWTLG